MNRLDVIRLRDESWHKIEDMKDTQEKMKNKNKSIEYSNLIKKEKFKYKIFNEILKAKK